jgi:hypothetical protein
LRISFNALSAAFASTDPVVVGVKRDVIFSSLIGNKLKDLSDELSSTPVD